MLVVIIKIYLLGMFCGIISGCINAKVIEDRPLWEGAWYSPDQIAYCLVNAILWFISIPVAILGIIFWTIDEYSFIHNRITWLREDFRKLEEKIKDKNLEEKIKDKNLEEKIKDKNTEFKELR